MHGVIAACANTACGRCLLSALNTGILKASNDLIALLSSVASVQDLVSGLVFSLLLFVDISIAFNIEVFMKTNLFTVFQAVKFERASLWGLKRRADGARDS